MQQPTKEGNRTLSLIEEEEEFMTNDDANSSAPRGMSLGNSQKIIIEETSPVQSVHQSEESLRRAKIGETSGIVRDIENMEREFTQFLEQIYN